MNGHSEDFEHWVLEAVKISEDFYIHNYIPITKHEKSELVKNVANIAEKIQTVFKQDSGTFFNRRSVEDFTEPMKRLYELTKSGAIDQLETEKINDLEVKLMRMVDILSGVENSLLKGISAHPQAATEFTFASVALISLFFPIRDIFYQHKNIYNDCQWRSMISCRMEDTLKEYFPIILYWRLQHVEMAYSTDRDTRDLQYDFAYKVDYDHIESLYANGLKFDKCKGVSCLLCTWKKDGDRECFKDLLLNTDKFPDYMCESQEGMDWCRRDYFYLIGNATHSFFKRSMNIMQYKCSRGLIHRSPGKCS